MSKDRLIIKNSQKEDEGGGSGGDFVSYDQSDNKNNSEQYQARTNIGSTSSEPQVISTSGAINNLAITSNNLHFTGTGVELSGIQAGEDGQEVTIFAQSTMSLLRNSSLSSASNRFDLGSFPTTIQSRYGIRVKYNSIISRWVFMSIEEPPVDAYGYLRSQGLWRPLLTASAFTPTLTGTGLTFSYTIAEGRVDKIGSFCHIRIRMVFTASGTPGGGNLIVNGLPSGFRGLPNLIQRIPILQMQNSGYSNENVGRLVAEINGNTEPINILYKNAVIAPLTTYTNCGLIIAGTYLSP